MSVIARITKDGLLSIAGMLVEDPALEPLARFASDGTLYVHILIEDPALGKVEWGRAARCREFWESLGEAGLWKPAQYFIYLTHKTSDNSYVISRIETENLTITHQIKYGSIGALNLVRNRDENYFYGIAGGRNNSIVVIQIKPLAFIGIFSLTNPSSPNFNPALCIDDSYFHIINNGEYILKYYRSNKTFTGQSSRFNYADYFLFRYSGFSFSVGPISNNRLCLGKTNYTTKGNYSLYYDYTQTLFAYPKCADLLDGFIYVITAYSIIKFNCGICVEDGGPMSLTKRITHNLNLLFKEISTPKGALLLARDFLYVIYTDISYKHYVRKYNLNDLSLVSAQQISAESGTWVFLVTDDENYLYVFMYNKKIHKIKKSTLEVVKTTDLSAQISIIWYAQNCFIANQD